MSPDAFACLVDGRPVDPPDPLTRPEDLADLLDWMAETHHGPDGRGPEHAGAALALHLLGYHLQRDDGASTALETLRRAVAHEDDAERKAPSATTALAAARALDDLHRALIEKTHIKGFYALLFAVLPTPIHARYALSILAETATHFGEHVPLLFRATADRVVGHAETTERDHEYVERIRFALPM